MIMGVIYHRQNSLASRNFEICILPQILLLIFFKYHFICNLY
jgi:hypothetical protein